MEPSPEVATAGEAAMSLARSSMLVAVFLSAASTDLQRAPGFEDTMKADIETCDTTANKRRTHDVAYKNKSLHRSKYQNGQRENGK
ncbi:uncharacterized protein HKW66_Vig0120740 [Vigna angularis]|uniref:Uncharacterized protein n=2 Tax=Phaseolus angularis TaxID=3914 RepID=A0A8T0JWF8_PHAAN|nr:uncharacterized protein HKW66_Vig0120740 [Vigna angularis]